MPSCLGCLGEGVLDFRDMDAAIGEHWTEQQIADAVAAGMRYPLGIVLCQECEGTGVMSEDRYKDLMARARADVDQALAKFHDTGAV